jgi:hypothetical protein
VNDDLTRLERIIALPYEDRVLAEDLLVREAMTPSWVHVIHASERQFEALARYLGRTPQNGALHINGHKITPFYEPPEPV